MTKSSGIFSLSGVIILPVAFMFFLLTGNCRQSGNEEDNYRQDLLARAQIFFSAMPETAFEPGNEATPKLIELGKMLYYEPRLSRSGLISCHTCHNLSLSGTDNLPVSIGHRWRKGRRNAPTVLNAALHGLQFHDGREPDVESQALLPIVDSVEMAAVEDHVTAVLSSIPEYSKLFAEAFPDQEKPVTYINTGIAIGAFERMLLTYSPFDEFIKGDLESLDPEELRGLEVFMNKGCIACHVTAAFGGQTFARFITPAERSSGIITDTGRFEATGAEEDRHFFKVPSLLNVAGTFPYFHDGSEWSLAEAIKEISRSQLAVELSEEEVDHLIVFMNALSGEPSSYSRELPLLPPSAPGTPRPEF
jgi:cytochrome c peroxidase